jgi:hypothetical protein
MAGLPLAPPSEQRLRRRPATTIDHASRSSARKLLDGPPTPDGARKDGRAFEPRWWVVRVPLAPVAEVATGEAHLTCPRCGCRAFTVHQRLGKAVKDPQIKSAHVVRYQCKKCGAIVRRYPDGVQAGRQSVGLRQLSVLLYCLGFSYRDVQDHLSTLGCPLSTTSIRRNVVAARAVAPAAFLSGRCSLALDRDERWPRQDGPIDVQLVALTGSERWLEVAIEPRLGPAIQERLLTLAAWLEQYPPESVPGLSARPAMC